MTPTDVHQYDSTLVDMFDEATQQYSQRVCYVEGDNTLTFAQLEERSAKFCAYLQDHGVKKGDRVALMCPNTLEFMVCMWGIIRTGAVQVNTNPNYTTRELTHQLTDASVSLLVFHHSATATVQQSLTDIPQCKLVCIDAPDTNAEQMSETMGRTVTCFSHALKMGESLPVFSVSIEPSDKVFLQYTGGTTGFSKGAVLLHSNIVANIDQSRDRLGDLLEGDDNVILTVLPAYHIFALTVNTMLYFALGGKNILITNPKDAPLIVKQWEEHQVTAITGVNTLYNGLMNFEPFRALSFDSLRLAVGGGTAVLSSTAKSWKELTGVALFEGYGLSETAPVASLNCGDENGGIGKPVKHTTFKLIDDTDNEVASGERGEIAVKGPQVMQGYWQNEQANSQSFTSDGFFKTGDIGTLDENQNYHIVDRKKDMILVSGFNVYPNEVENAVCQHPGVLEAACVGGRDDKQGERVRVFVVLKDDSVTKEAITEVCREHLAAYKVPKEVNFVDELPKSGVGKILRRKLKDD
ncbi:AMP-binding protein [Alteromonas lipotrueiana]|uniref:AMP-binding protein n=1 Tax=Alteromonas lipotrueiana TaxID=2803815 RepID=UPI001FE5B25B|nr:AMP-binding protein [Alteromonas lipotrueiana]